jgi:hypothetical protein
MQRGAPVIVPADLTHEGWNGRPDILRPIEAPTRMAAPDLGRGHSALARPLSALGCAAAGRGP